MANSRPKADADWVMCLDLCPLPYVTAGLKIHLGGRVYAFSEMVDRISAPREFYAPFANLATGVIGPGGCESPFNDLPNKRTAAGQMGNWAACTVPGAQRIWRMD